MGIVFPASTHAGQVYMLQLGHFHNRLPAKSLLTLNVHARQGLQ